jgi:hypothetical protein
MSPEHADLEADWLASELKRATEYARTAYESKEDAKRQLFLANLIGTLDSLYTHYRVLPVEAEAYEQPDKPQYAPAPRQHKRGPVARFFLGGD